MKKLTDEMINKYFNKKWKPKINRYNLHDANKDFLEGAIFARNFYEAQMDLNIVEKCSMEFYNFDLCYPSLDFRCGQGDNRCKCNSPDECGYIEFINGINNIP